MKTRHSPKPTKNAIFKGTELNMMDEIELYLFSEERPIEADIEYNFDLEEGIYI